VSRRKIEFPPKKKKALIYGGYGTGNIGDEAILSGLLKTISYDEIIVFSSNPHETAALHKVRAEKTNIKPFLLCDDLIIGGGELFQDGMAWKFSLATILAKILAKNVRVVGIGVDVSNPIEKVLTSLSLKFADEISVRDKRSFKNLVSMGLSPNKIKLVTDFVFYLKPEQLEPTEETQFFLEKHDLLSNKFVVIFLRSKNPETDKRLLAFFKNVIINLAQSNSSLRILLVPLSKHPNSLRDDDRIIIQRLKDNVESNFLIVFDKQLDPSSLLYLISKADLVISTRLHPLIFSEITNTKAIAIPLFPKIRSFAKKQGYPIVETENLEKLYAVLDRLK
jgi:polysaccharide pyruvyl transferase WcaK-like protein